MRRFTFPEWCALILAAATFITGLQFVVWPHPMIFEDSNEVLRLLSDDGTAYPAKGGGMMISRAFGLFGIALSTVLAFIAFYRGRH